MALGFRIVSGIALSLALASAPVSARDWRGGGYYGHGYRHHGGGGIGLGGALLGAAIIGGIAVAASNNSRNTVVDRGYDPNTGGAYESYGSIDTGPLPADGPGPGPDGALAQGPGQDPVEDCSRAAERQAQGQGGYARVTNIDRVDDIEGGARVRGTLDIDRGGQVPVQRVGFTCSASNGHVTDVRLG